MAISSKKIFSYIKIALVTLLILFFSTCIFALIFSAITKKPLPTAFGVGACVVISGSMEPTISVDDIIVVKQSDGYKLDDIVLFTEGDSLVVHRIVIANENSETFTTRGDANKVNDQPINKDEIIGRVIFIIPYAGKLVNFLKSPYGIVAVIAVCYIVYSLSSIFRKIKKT